MRRAGSKSRLRSSWNAEMPATRNATVSPEAIIMCAKRYGKLGLKMIAIQSAACSWPSTTVKPCGVCIQELSARIQNAESGGADRHQECRQRVQPGRHAVAPEQHHAEERCFEEERGQHFVAEQRPGDVAGLAP